MDATSKDTLLDWFSGKLLEESNSLEALHRSLLVELKLKLDALPTLQASGTVATAQENDKGLSLTVDGAKAPGNDAGKGDTAAAAAVAQTAPHADSVHHGSKKEILGHKGSKLPHELKGLEGEVQAQNIFQRIVWHKRFEWFFGAVIVSHIVVMTFESQYVGLGVGHDVRYEGYTQPRKDVWPGGELTFSILDYIFGTTYTFELVLKILALRLHFLDAWNALDLAIVFFWYLDKLTASVELPIDTMLLRLLRLSKLLRLVKVLRSLTGFEQLFLMLTALRGSFRILCWVAILLCTCLISFALLANQILVSNFLLDEEVSIERKLECFRYFGTFSRALFSMFEMTFAGGWTTLGRFLLEDVNEFLGMICILYKLTMGFSVIAVINGCFFKETFKLAEQDDLLMIIQKDKERKVHAEKMLKLLDMADTKGDGTLTKDEFIDVCKNPEIDKWLGAQGLRVTDAGAIFDLIDEHDSAGEGLIHKQELVAGVRKLQGNSRSLDVAKNHLQVCKNRETLDAALTYVNVKIDAIHRATTEKQQPPTTLALPETSGAQPSSDFKEEISRLQLVMQDLFSGLAKEILEMKKVLATRSLPQPPTINVVQGATVQDNPRTKHVLWGCN